MSCRNKTRSSIVTLILFTILIVMGLGCGSQTIQKARRHLEAGEYSEAKGLLEIEIASDPKSVEAYLLLGEANLMLLDDMEAADAFEKAVLLDTSAKRRVEKEYISAGKTLLANEEADLEKGYEYLTVGVESGVGIGQDLTDWALSYTAEQSALNRTSRPAAVLLRISSLKGVDTRSLSQKSFAVAKSYLEKGFLKEAARYAEVAGTINSEMIGDSADLLREIGLRSKVPEQEGTAKASLDTAILWKPEFREDEEVAWFYAANLTERRAQSIAEFIEKFPNSTHLGEAQRLFEEAQRAVREQIDERIEMARELIEQEGEYSRAIDVLEAARQLDPSYTRVEKELQSARENRYMSHDRFSRARKGMTEDEVRSVLGQVKSTNTREFPERGVMGWFYRKKDGGAAAVYFKFSSQDECYKVYAVDYNAIKASS